MAAEKEKPNFKVVADNRRARYDYEIGETFEAGLMLTGTEVKSLRTGKATVAESYAAVDRGGEIILYNANIPEYLQANRFNHEPKRPRKLLLHAKEIAKLAKGVEREGMTIVPLRITLTPRAEPRSRSRSGAARSCTTSGRARKCATGTATSRGSCANAAEPAIFVPHLPDHKSHPGRGRSSGAMLPLSLDRARPSRHAAAFSAWSRSARMSSMCSMPIERRT